MPTTPSKKRRWDDDFDTESETVVGSPSTSTNPKSAPSTPHGRKRARGPVSGCKTAPRLKGATRATPRQPEAPTRRPAPAKEGPTRAFISKPGTNPLNITYNPSNDKQVLAFGMCVGLVGKFYPGAVFRIAHIDRTEPDAGIETNGEGLILQQRVMTDWQKFRIIMLQCDVATESPIKWRGEKKELQFIHDLVDLGCTKGCRLMMLSYHDAKDLWAFIVARQIPKKEYSLEECLDILEVGRQQRGQVMGFSVQGRTPTKDKSFSTALRKDVAPKDALRIIRTLVNAEQKPVIAIRVRDPVAVD